MKHMCTILTASILGCVAFPQAEARSNDLPILEGKPSVWAAMGQGMEEGMRESRNFRAQELQEEKRYALEEKRLQAILEANLAAQSAAEAINKSRLEAAAIEQAKNNKILQDVLQGYTPAKNAEYVLKVLQSPLPMDIKQVTIAVLNEQAALSSDGSQK